MKNEEKQQALKLRIEQQLSIKAISQIVGMSKSTLSMLFRKHNLYLPEEVIKERKLAAQMIGSRANRLKSQERRKINKDIGRKLISKDQSFRDLCLLYWGEGSKTETTKSFVICNTDPYMIKAILKSLENLNYNKHVKLTCHCYENSDHDSILRYWKVATGHDVKIYIAKNSSVSKRKRTDKQPYGTMHVRVSRLQLLDMVLGGIEWLKQQYS